MTAAVRRLSFGMGDPFARTSGPIASPSLGERLEGATLEANRTPRALIGHLLATGLAVGIFRSIDPQGPWLAWLTVVMGLWGARLLWWCAFRQGWWPAPANMLNWGRGNTLLILMQGLVAGVACAAVQPAATGFQQATLLTVLFACVLAAVPSLINRPAVLSVYGVCTTGPMAAAVLLDSADPEHLSLVGSVVLLLGLVVWTASSYRSAFLRITHLKERADSLRRSVSDAAIRAEQARLEAEVADRFKTQLLAAASHDLRQPLTALRLYALQLRHGTAAAGHTTALDGLQQGIEALDTMLHDLLSVAARQRGALMAVPRGVELGEIYERLRPQLNPCAFDRGLDLRWLGGHRLVWADPDMLERCLRNLVTNAIEHTEDGGVLVLARSRGPFVVLQVWDSGCGLTAEHQSRLFEAGSTPARQGGRGLGLTIVRQLAHLMGAQLSVRSRLGRGTVFELLLPLSGQGAAPAAAAPASTLHC